ncbi:MAG: FaeA/PapI family transcriptional regulator [bacterium]
MKKKGIGALYKDALKMSHQELERASALDALTNFDNLDLRLGEFVDLLKKSKTWGPFSQLTLAELLGALEPRGSKPGRRAGRRPGPSRKKAVPLAKKPPPRLTKRVSAKAVLSILDFLTSHPDSRTADIAAHSGLNNKQAASLLKKLRSEKVVSTRGQRAGMVYSLTNAKPPSTKKTSKKGAKKAAKKAANRRPAKKVVSKAPRAPRKPHTPSSKK